MTQASIIKWGFLSQVKIAKLTKSVDQRDLGCDRKRGKRDFWVHASDRKFLE